MAVKTPHPVFETTDTFSQLISSLNTQGDQYDSDIKYLDSAVGDRNLLTTTSTSPVDAGSTDLVTAINELDSDLHGSGGGTFASLTNTEGKTVVAAINEIEAVFDASTFTVTSSSNLTFNTTGNEIHTVGGNLTYDIAGNVDIDVGGGVLTFTDDGEARITNNLGATNTIDVAGDYVLDVAGDITLDAAGATILFRDSDVTRISHELGASNVVTVTGNYELDATGDITFDAGDNDFIINGNETERVRVVAAAAVEVQFSGTSTELSNDAGDFTIDAVGDIILNAAGNNVKLFAGDSEYADLRAVGGQLSLRSGPSSTEAILFNGANMTFKGTTTLPASSTPGTSVVLGSVLSDLNTRIPNVYNAAGTLLNPLP